MTNNATQQEKLGVCVYIPKILNGVSYICILNICTGQGIFKGNELHFQEDRLVSSPRTHILKSCLTSV